MPRAAPVTRATLPFNRFMCGSAARSEPRSAEWPDRILAVPIDARAPRASEHLVHALCRGNQLDEAGRARAVAHVVDRAAARHRRGERDVIAAPLVLVPLCLDVVERDAEMMESVAAAVDHFLV